MPDSKNGSGTYGPSWTDVRTQLIELAKRWGGVWSFELTDGVNVAGKPTQVIWGLWRKAYGLQHKQEDTLMGTMAYPHPDHRTVPGLLCRIAWEVDEKLLQAEADATPAQTSLPF